MVAMQCGVNQCGACSGNQPCSPASWNINFQSNLWWMCMFSLCLKLNGPHHPYSQIWPQNCLPQGGRWLVWICGTINRGCWYIHSIQIVPVSCRGICWQEYPLAVSPTLPFSFQYAPNHLMPELWDCIAQSSTREIMMGGFSCTQSI